MAMMIPSFFGNQRSSNSPFNPFSFDVWDPFQDFRFPSISSQFPQETSGLINTRVDWKETPKAHVLKADLPGMKKEEVKLEVEDDRVILISGERNVDKEDNNDKWHRVERSRGRCSRRFKLPANVIMDQIKDCLENGVLTLTLPKQESNKLDVKAIQISG